MEKKKIEEKLLLLSVVWPESISELKLKIFLKQVQDDLIHLRSSYESQFVYDIKWVSKIVNVCVRFSNFGHLVVFE